MKHRNGLPIWLHALVFLPLLAHGCNRDWDPYDPRLGSGGAGSTGTSASSSGSSVASGSGGTGGASSSSSSASGMGGAGGSGGAPTCMLPLKDDFNDNMIDASKWAVFLKAATVEEANGELLMTLQPATTGYGMLQSKLPYDMSDCSVQARVVEVPNANVMTFAVIQLSSAQGYAVEILFYAGTMYFKKIIADVHTDLFKTPYDATEHVFWRFREAAGTTYWETSPDGQQWKTWASEADPIPMNSVRFALLGGMDEATASPGNARFDNVNLP